MIKIKAVTDEIDKLANRVLKKSRDFSPATKEIAGIMLDAVEQNFEDEYIYVAETKTDEPRTIPICESLLSTLLQMKKESDCEFVFTTPNGKPYTSKTVWKTTWGSTLKSSGIPKGRFHDFRHTFMTDLIVDEKEDFATVMALSGHKSMSMLKRYTHTKEEAKKSAMKKRENRVNISTMDTYLDTKPDIGNPDEDQVIPITNSKH
ncbi:MAG: tyrosine-type recombinase/integrase [Candidatus Dadabacteria bacterium]|nr:tyrosine-type recombinase/integrase [Candidatus Dadabacteria bacterium]